MAPAIVFAAASLAPTPRLRARLAAVQGAFVVAADGGATTALAFGITPDVLIGDFDSLAPDVLIRLRSLQVQVEEYPRDKDATDGQLAVERALAETPEALFLVGFLGGARLDHGLANIMLLTQLSVPTLLLDERNEARLLTGPTTYVWKPEPSEVISLLPLTEEVRGIHTGGLRWPLRGETLRRGETRGVSNEASAVEATVQLEEGLLLLTRHFV